MLFDRYRFLLSACCGLFFLTLWATPALEAEEAAWFTVEQVQGEVKYRAPRSRSAVNLKVHHALETGGRVWVPQGASIKITSPRHDEISCDENSYLKLSEYVDRGRRTQTKLHVYKGLCHFKVNPLQGGSRFVVENQRMTISVKGTSFSVSDSGASVSEGLIAVVPADAPQDAAPIEVAQGEAIVVSDEGVAEVVSGATADLSSSDKVSEQESTINSSGVSAMVEHVEEGQQSLKDVEQEERTYKFLFEVKDVNP